MNGNKVFKLAVKSMQSSCEKLIKRNDIRISEIDWLISHQANMRIIEALGKKLKIDKDHVIVNIEKYANTSAATIPIAISEAIEMWKIKRGDLLLMVSFGAGLTWGSALIRY
jgi:3-oxoacyl-[acyl-carrier-protein] synthase-3